MPNNSPEALNLIWGANSIGRVLGLSGRQAFFLLETKKLPSARKIGGRWCVRHRDLEQIFEAGSTTDTLGE